MKKVAVLGGGCSSERDVSLSSAKGVLKALQDAGYDAFFVDIGHDLKPFIETMTTQKPDVVFNALHGMFGEDGCVQGVLDLMQIPYTHSGRLASALAMDKVRAKEIFQCAGIPVAKGGRVSKQDILTGNLPAGPLVLKPVENGSFSFLKTALRAILLKVGNILTRTMNPLWPKNISPDGN